MKLTKEEAKKLTGEHIVIPEGYTVIGDSAFWMRKDIISVVIPDGVTEIEKFAFDCCVNLAEVTVPEGVTALSGWYVFGRCKNLKTVRLPASVTHIDKRAFSGSKNLTVQCTAGSYVHEFCQSRKINFEVV